jgi:hypothetical protein
MLAYLINLTETNVDVEEHFRTLGVTVDRLDNYYHFSYNLIDVVWNEITYQCRGSIYKYKDNVWTCVCRPYDKFFNLQEGKCPLFSLEEYPDLELREKTDGTMITFWVDDGKFFASTTGKIVPTKINDYDFTFAQLFFKLFKLDATKIESGKTYLFELCSRYNHVVTIYDNDSIFLNSIRDNITGDYSDFGEMMVFSNRVGVKIGKKFKFSDFGIKTKEQLIAWVEEESTKEDVYGTVPEGFVVYQNNQPVAKVKNQRYVLHHHHNTGSKNYILKNIINSFFLGFIDDFYGSLLQPEKDFIDKLKEDIRTYQIEVDEFSDSLPPGIDQKEYALLVKTKKHQAFLFDKSKEFRSGEKVLFSTWLLEKGKNKPNYETMMDYWKSLHGGLGEKYL